MRRIGITAALLASMALPVVAQTGMQPMPPPPRGVGEMETISVTGVGKSTVVPDRFSFTVGVVTQAPTVDDAVNRNNAQVADVIAGLKKAGATEREIRTSSFSIMPQQDYQQGQPPRVVGYQVSNSVTVTRDNPATVGKLLQVAVSAGVNQASGIEFSVADPSKGRDAGLQSAIADARSKASVLALAAGRALGRALMISEGGASAPPPHPMYASAMMAKSEVSQVPIEQGTQENTYTVSVVFELR